MPRFFFHVVNSEFMPDHVGVECPTPDAVKEEAIRAAGALIKEQGLQVWTTASWYMFVCDEQNRTHLKLAFNVEDMRGELSGGKDH